jgi:FkbM family methyltransferase
MDHGTFGCSLELHNMKSFFAIITKIRVRASRIIRKVIWSRKVAVGKPVRFELPGGTNIQLHPAGQIAQLLFTHDFESSELRLCKRSWRPGSTVIDIGANIGLYSIAASLAVGPEGKVYSFEPSSESRLRLTRNLALNGCANVTVIGSALSNVSVASATLVRAPGYLDGDRYLTSSVGSQEAASAELVGGDSETVSVYTLDDWSNGFPNLDASFLKIDIEGGELAVFHGAHDFLHRHRDLLIMFECTPQACERAGCKQDDVFRLLGEAGFALYAWLDGSGCWTSDERHLKRAGNVWAARSPNLLPN